MNDKEGTSPATQNTNMARTVNTAELANTLGVDRDTIDNIARGLHFGIVSRVFLNGRLGYVFTKEQALAITKEVESNHTNLPAVIDTPTTVASSTTQSQREWFSHYDNESSGKTMTTKELAKTLGVSNMAIMRVLESTNNLNGTVKVQNGVTTRFTQAQATLIKREIQSHHNLQQRDTDGSRPIDKVTSEMDVLLDASNIITRLKSLYEAKLAEAEELKKTVDRQSTLLEEQQPKVDFYQSFMDATGYLSVGEVAKVLASPPLDIKISRNRLFEILRDKGVFMTSITDRNKPYQSLVDKKLFIVKSMTLPNGNNTTQTYVTAKGLEYIHKLLLGENRESIEGTEGTKGIE